MISNPRGAYPSESGVHKGARFPLQPLCGGTRVARPQVSPENPTLQQDLIGNVSHKERHIVLYKGGQTSMQQLTMRQKAHRVTRFVIVQFIALVGWIIVQSFFSLSPLGQTIPFAFILIIEAIWWIATLAIMLRLFIWEYSRFVQSAVELEDANRKLREATNQILAQIRDQSTQAGNRQTP